jgi:hypothetical protein
MSIEQAPILGSTKEISNNPEMVESFNKFSEYEDKTLKNEKPKSARANKLMRALVIGTFLIGFSMGNLAIGAKTAEAQEHVIKKEKKEQLRILVSGTIDGKIRFEIDNTDYNPEKDKDLLQAIKAAEDEYAKTHSLEAMQKSDSLSKEAYKKSFKIFINGKETKILSINKMMDGGSHYFDTDQGTIFIPYSESRDFSTEKKIQPIFTGADNKEHAIHIETNNMFK